MSKQIRIEKLLERSLNSGDKKSPESSLLKEAEGAGSESTNKVFDLLDEARKALQDAQASIYIQMPNTYQQAYKGELDSIYNHCGQAIAELQVLAKKIHSESGV